MSERPPAQGNVMSRPTVLRSAGGPLRRFGHLVAVWSGLVAASPLMGQEVIELSGTDRPINLNLEEVFAIGRVDGAEWEIFHTLDAAAFDAEGRLYLLDASSDRVVAIRDGTLDHFVGRKGDGPAEYRQPDGLVRLSDGGMAVWDSGKEAFVLFAPDGSSLDQVAPDYSVGVPAGPLTSFSEESALALPVHVVSGRRGAIYQTSGGFRSATDGLPLLRVPIRQGAHIDVLATVPTLQGGAVNPATRAFFPEPSWGPVAGARVALVESDQYRILILDENGPVVKVLRRAVEARPTTAADEAAFRRFAQEEYERSARGAPRGLRPVPPSGEVNAHPVIPPIQRIMAGGTTKIWVQRPDDDNPTRPGPIDILDADGSYLGTLSDTHLGLPSAFGPDGLVVFLTTGVMDVPIARVYRLPEALR